MDQFHDLMAPSRPIPQSFIDYKVMSLLRGLEKRLSEYCESALSDVGLKVVLEPHALKPIESFIEVLKKPLPLHGTSKRPNALQRLIDGQIKLQHFANNTTKKEAREMVDHITEVTQRIVEFYAPGPRPPVSSYEALAM